MNKIKYSAVAVLSMLVTLTMVNVSARAAQEVNYDGYVDPNNQWELSSDVKKYTVKDGRVVTDFFGEATKNLSPGDEVKGITVDLKNRTSEDVVFYMKAEPVEGSEAIDLAEGDFADKIAIEELLDFVYIKITYSNPPRIIYDGTLRGNGNGLYSNDGIMLGKVSPNQTGRIEVSIGIDENIGNNYQNAMASINWFIDVPKPTPIPTFAPTNEPTGESTEEPINRPTGRPLPTNDLSTTEPTDLTEERFFETIETTELEQVKIAEVEKETKYAYLDNDLNPKGNYDIKSNEEKSLSETDEEIALLDVKDDDSALGAPDFEVEAIPTTGDETGIFEFATVAAIALCGLLFMLIFTILKKSKKE